MEEVGASPTEMDERSIGAERTTNKSPAYDGATIIYGYLWLAHSRFVGRSCVSVARVPSGAARSL